MGTEGVMTTQDLFPHICPDYRCAICRWVREKWSGREAENTFASTSISSMKVGGEDVESEKFGTAALARDDP